MKWLKEEAPIIVSVVVTLISAIISEALPNVWMKVLFIIFFVAGVVFFLSYINDPNKNGRKRAAILICAICSLFILVVPAIVNNSAGDYVSRLREFFRSARNEDMIDQGEVETILAIIKERAAKRSGDGTRYYSDDLTNNVKETELFYKIELSTELFHYDNILTAMEQYSFDCEKLGIDEKKLMSWDLEMLYIKYNERESLEENSSDDEIVELRLDFQDYKFNETQYCDTLDYGSWAVWYRDTIEEIRKGLRSDMEGYYAKIIMNLKE